MGFKLKNKEYFDTPMTYAGRLDPLAEGLLLVLSGEEIQRKDSYLELQKTYIFDVLWGFATDTGDVLGLVSKKEVSVPTTIEVKKRLSEVVGRFKQKYPVYSSKPINGMPLLEWARSGRLSEIEIPDHEVELFQAEHLTRRSITGEKLLNEIKSKIKSVIGDFRQKEILNKWVELLLRDIDREFVIDQISINVSGGFYVRQFVSDLAEFFDEGATTFHIKRIKVGDFELEDIEE
jgi:tRNA pseudouridine(55) synthase